LLILLRNFPKGLSAKFSNIYLRRLPNYSDELFTKFRDLNVDFVIFREIKKIDFRIVFLPHNYKYLLNDVKASRRGMKENAED
jgi:hypothetical protein